jgi:RHS repeat-associated protein
VRAGGPGPSLLETGDIDTMQAQASIRVRHTFMTPPFACLLSAASDHPSIFTGKERDTESGNDYFEARYYSSNLGRFMSPDWSAKEEPIPYAKLDNPQSLNLYAYVGNNPATEIDADGHCADKDALCQGLNAGFDTLHGNTNSEAVQQLQQSQDRNDLRFQTAQQQLAKQQALSAVKTGDNSSYFTSDVNWKLSLPSTNGGFVVQHVTADFKGPGDPHTGPADYWEAWQVAKGHTDTIYHGRYGFDDRFQGGYGTKIHAEARFYEGLKLPNSFKAGSVYYAHGLRSTNADPHLPTENATPPVIRDLRF